ncbi:MAG: glycosyltransferase, partial [Candidatus Brocadiia bacterium]
QSEGENKIELEHHRDSLKGLGINAHSLQPAVWIKPEDEQFSENIFNQYNLNPDKTIALFAAAQFDHRVYQHYGKALSEFCRKNNFKVIALGAQQDYEINRKNLDAIGVESFNLSGKTTILQSAAIIKLCKMAVGAETSLAHIACAVGTPNVILLGGGHFGRFIPYSPLTSIACLPLECYGCNWGCRYRTPHCVKDLAPQVLSEALKQTFEIPSQKSRIFIQGNSLWQRDPEKPQWKSCEDLININNVEIIPVGSDTPHPERNIDNTEVRQAAYNLFRQKPLIAKSITPKNEFGKKIPAEKKMSIEIPNILLKSKIDLPYISIVTPSYNQSKYLEECIDSILSQKYPNLEYIIMDGGSTDGSIEIIKKYEKHLAYWQSKPDGGQYKAIEEGFRRSTGEIMAWINSDDKHHPDSLFKAAYIFNKHADIEWITARPTAWNSQGQLISVGPVPVWDGKEHNRTGRKEHYIQQEATFWKRTLWNKAGAKLNTQLQFAGDFELWVRFFKHAQLYSVDTLLGGFRHHTNQKTKVSMEKYYQEAEQTVQAEQADNQSACLRTAPEPLPFENKDFFIFKALALNSQVTENKPGSLLPDNASGYKYDVSIVLSTKDRAQLLDQMLNSLEDAVAGLNYELIVIEGDSSDNTSEILGKHGVTKIYNELEHLGSGKHSWSQLYNFGFSKARGKWAMYASDDIIFSKNCITNAVVRLNRQNDRIAGGIFFYKNSMSRLDWDKYGIDFTHGSKLLLNYGLVRLEHFRKVGGLDEIYKFYCADTDLCYKLYQEGL